MNLYAHISYNGTCREAFELYADCFRGEITSLLTYADSPLAAGQPELADKVVHATLKMGNNTLSGADVPPERYAAPQGFAIQVNLDDLEDATRAFEMLSPGGNIQLPLQRTFWADLYSIFTDRFGTPWEINYSEKD